MLLLLLACQPDKAPEFVGDFLIDPVALGDARAVANGVETGDLPALGLAMAAGLPIFGEDPAWEVPQAVFNLLTPEVVQDQSVCPAAVVLDDGIRWQSDCRSTDGYEFSGTADQREWDADDGHRRRFEADLDVVGDVENAAFNTVGLHGFVEQVIPESGDVLHHLDLNLALAVDGYWEVHGPSDPRLEQWSDWRVTGSVEARHDGEWTVDLVVQVADVGGFLFGSNSLQTDGGCPVELKGEATLGGEVTATLGGVSSCDACAEIANSGASLGSACAP